MAVIKAILNVIVGLLDLLLPILGVPDAFFTQLDTGISSFISILESVSWFIPINTLVICFNVMIIADNWTLIVRLAQWIIKTIRG